MVRKEHETYGEKEITCPYCEHQCSDSWEYSDEYGQHSCAECGKNFHWSRDITVEYSSSQDCGLNKEGHHWGAWGAPHESDWGGWYRHRKCATCGQGDCEKVPVLRKEG